MTHEPRRPARRTYDPTVAWALLGVVVVAVIVGVAIMLTRPSPVDAPEPSDASPAASGGISHEPAGPPITVDEGTWWRFGWADATSQDDSAQLRIGRLDGTVTATFDLPREAFGAGFGPPFVRGPASGLVLVAAGGAASTTFTLVDAASGITWLLPAIPGDVPDAIMSADGRTIYYLIGDNNGLAVASIQTDGSAPTPVAAPRPRVAMRDGIVLAARIQRQATIALSADGKRIAVLDCFSTCEARLISIASGETSLLRGFSAGSTLGGWTAAGIDIGGTCVDPATGLPREQSCGVNVPLVEAAVELPEGWHAERRPLPDAEPLDFRSTIVAVGPDGGEVPLDSLGLFCGNC